MSQKKIIDPHLRAMRRAALKRGRFTKKQWIRHCKNNPGALAEIRRLNNLSEEELNQLRTEVALEEMKDKKSTGSLKSDPVGDIQEFDKIARQGT